MPFDFIKIEKPLDIKVLDDSLRKDQYYSQELTLKVSHILQEIKNRGDEALIYFCQKYDNSNATSVPELKIPELAMESAASEVPQKYPRLVEALDRAYHNLMEYHKAQFEREPKTWFLENTPGKKLGQLLNPLERVGIYIPGGRFIYPSSVLMAAIPAIIAGVAEIVVCTPPQKNGDVNEVLLYLFSRMGIKEIYKIGGAQAIAALAFGTQSLKKVDKIAGPGNVYVTLAKKLVFGSVGIDSLAGPSEILVIADESANPSFAAADLLSQAEHDPGAKSILLTNDEKMAGEVIKELYRQLDMLAGKSGSTFDLENMLKALKDNCRVIFNPDLDFLIEASNIMAPEHLEIMVKEWKNILPRIKNAGAIFLGNYTPVAAGDYICGTNHIIPTAGTAKFSSPLGVYDFCKKSSVAFYDKAMLEKEGNYIQILSEYENLLAHGNSIRVRLEE